MFAQGADHGLADPGKRIGRELVTATEVELVDRLDQAEIALLDQVAERQPPIKVATRERDHQALVALDDLVAQTQGFGLLPAGDRRFDPREHFEFLLPGENLRPADLLQIAGKQVVVLTRQETVIGRRVLGIVRFFVDGSHGDPALTEQVQHLAGQLGVIGASRDQAHQIVARERALELRVTDEGRNAGHHVHDFIRSLDRGRSEELLIVEDVFHRLRIGWSS